MMRCCAVAGLLTMWGWAGWLLGAEGVALVVRNLADPATATWTPGAWNSATGSVRWTDDRPPQAAAAGRAALELAVRYSGKGFEFFAVDLANPEIPGRCRRVRVWVKADKPGYSWAVKFKDADGKEETGGKKLECDLKATVGEWSRVEFTAPEQWKQPLRLVGLAAHNWGHQREAAEVVLRVCDLQVETDVTAVADHRSLLKVDVATDVPRNLFLQGEPVRFRVVCDSWLGQPLPGVITYRVTDAAGAEVATGKREVRVDGAQAESLDLSPAKFGAYRLAVDVSFTGGQRFAQERRFAYVPRPLAHTAEEKRASPYGLNIHGGQPGVSYPAIARMGCVWVRDYAYNRQWLERARGDDGRYAGWPWYPALDRQLRESGLLLLPCLGDSLAPYVTAGKLQPDAAWKRGLVHILLTFPQYPAWELDNEYDYRHGREEEARGWSSYQAYHKLFAQAVKFMDEKTWAVEQGTAGVHPDWVRRSIQRGAFDQIDVVNGHFYCGIDPPERNTQNVNVGQEDAPPTLLFDQLRDFAQAADSDGRNRQAWITEFGWDTLAGPVVTEQQQAGYLQRGFVLGLQAGIDKLFWFWDRDTKEKPKQLFDGCGLFDPRDEPKPAAAALAGLAQFLKLPKPVGTFDLEPSIVGYVFRDRGRLVACVVNEQDAPVAVELPRGAVFDLYGNPLAGRRQPVSFAPVWVVGLEEGDPLVRETAYDLQSPRLVRAVAGDQCVVEVRVGNPRTEPLRARLEARAADRWTVTPASADVAVPAGGSQVFPFTVVLDAREAAGSRTVTVHVTEGDVEKRLTTQVLVVPAAQLTTSPLVGEPGTTKLPVRVKNNAGTPRSFVLRAEVPQGWAASPAELRVADVPGHATREAAFQLTWTDRWVPTAVARVTAATAAGEVVAQAGIIPGAIRIPRVPAIRCDGDLSDWPSAARLPAWALGRRGLDRRPAEASAPGGADGEVHLYAGYAPGGLYVAAQVDGSRAQVTDPRWFWKQDCLELFLDTRNDKQPRKAYRPTDHQFWLCPLVAEQRVYVGRWKRNDEIPETQYDVAGIQSFCQRTETGYVFEVLLPAAQFHEWKPTAGAAVGLNVNLTIPGAYGLGEVYWPLSKADDAPTAPHRWGCARWE